MQAGHQDFTGVQTMGYTKKALYELHVETRDGGLKHPFRKAYLIENHRWATFAGTPWGAGPSAQPFRLAKSI